MAIGNFPTWFGRVSVSPQKGKASNHSDANIEPAAIDIRRHGSRTSPFLFKTVTIRTPYDELSLTPLQRLHTGVDTFSLPGRERGRQAHYQAETDFRPHGPSPYRQCQSPRNFSCSVNETSTTFGLAFGEFAGMWRYLVSGLNRGQREQKGEGPPSRPADGGRRSVAGLWEILDRAIGICRVHRKTGPEAHLCRLISGIPDGLSLGGSSGVMSVWGRRRKT